MNVPEPGTLKSTCPLVLDPRPDCYCSILNSQSIEKMFHYCGSRFKSCSIYRRFAETEGSYPL